MRSFITKGGIPVFMSNTEHEFVEWMTPPTYKRDLSPRKAEIARILTSRGILNRYMDVDKGIYYVLNTHDNDQGKG